MAINRFTNKKEIIKDGKVQGQLWKPEDIPVLQLEEMTIKPSEEFVVEVHFYTPEEDGSYIMGGIIEDYEVQQDGLFINWSLVADQFNLSKAKYRVVINTYRNMLGDGTVNGLYVSEISGDRREVKIIAMEGAQEDVPGFLDVVGDTSFQEPVYKTTINDEGEEEVQYDEEGEPIIDQIIERPLPSDYAVNFGQNHIYKIINFKEWETSNEFIIRLYKELPDVVVEKDFLSIVGLLSDSYVDTIEISTTFEDPSTDTLRGPNYDSDSFLQGPNFNVDTRFGTISETDFKSWNDLLGDNTDTSQRIVDAYFGYSRTGETSGGDDGFSGSLDGDGFEGKGLNIDYSRFENWAFYSSAAERIKTFKYKLEQIEYYTKQKTTLEGALGADDTALQNNIINNTNRKNRVISSFDAFERWLYYEPTSSLFTHGISGSLIGADGVTLTPWPKFLSDGQYVVHHTTGSISEDWYNGFVASASRYDLHNENALVKTIPEYLRLDTNNDQYELFVNMIGHHYDILYTYINELSKKYKPEESPKVGRGRQTLYDVAETMGWKLTNGKQATALWQYKLGLNTSGSYSTTGSMFSKSDEDITTEVWRRIVNNLPYLLKTKGTARGIKALMNTYGIPQTLLSIREYGGPKVAEDVPLLIEDRFSYAAQFASGSHIMWGNNRYSSSFDYGSGTGSWGIPAIENTSIAPHLPAGIPVDQFNARPPDTREFRFRPALKQSMLLLSMQRVTTFPLQHLGIEYTASYSGSDKYGRLFFQKYTGGTGGADADVIGAPYGASAATSFTDWVPLYDGDFWNVRLWTAFPFITASINTNNSVSNFVPRFYFQVQKASDYISGKIVHRTTGSLFPGSGSSVAVAEYIIGGNAAYAGMSGATQYTVLGGVSHSFASMKPPSSAGFTGSIQEYREWLEILDQNTFDLHTLNPSSYVSSLSPTGSYDTLVRHYPLGTDNIAKTLGSTDTQVTSSHPAYKIRDFQLEFGLEESLMTTGQDMTDAFARSFPSPSNPERGNFVPVEETYYIQGVSLGGTLPKSQKIRLEDNDVRENAKLTPLKSAEESSFDNASIDSNRLGLFYSAADQINKEIFNHIGDVALDDYVGKPLHEFEFEYPDLYNFSKNYWKKYTNKNDLNAFIRVFSQFDFALFNQIRQLLPERIDESMGLLVEPHALERAKVKVTNRPIKEEPMYSSLISDTIPSSSAVVVGLTSSIDMPQKYISAQSLYHTGSSGGYVEKENKYFVNISGSQGGMPGGDPYEPMDYFNKQVLPAGPIAGKLDSQLLSYTASFKAISTTGSACGTRINTQRNSDGQILSGMDLINGARFSDKFHHNWGLDSGYNYTPGYAGTTVRYTDKHKVETLALFNTQSPPFAGISPTAASSAIGKVNYTGSVIVTDRASVSAVTSISNDSDNLFNLTYAPSEGYIYSTNTKNYAPSVVGTSVNNAVLINSVANRYGGRNFDFYSAGKRDGGTCAIELTIDNGLFSKKDTIIDMNTRVAAAAYSDADGLGLMKIELLGVTSKGIRQTLAHDHKMIVLHYAGPSGWDSGANIIDGGGGVSGSFGLHEIDFQDVHIGRNHRDLILRVQFIGLDWGIGGMKVARISPVITIKKVGDNVYNYDVCDQRPSNVYKLDKLHYSGSRSLGTQFSAGASVRGSQLRNSYTALSQSLGLGVNSKYNYSRSMDETSYRDDFFEQEQNQRYNGCRLVGPGINIPSSNASIGNAPVVEIFSTNPNKITYNPNQSKGNPGTLVVR